MSRPLQVLIHHDVLCGWCYLAQARLLALRQELGATVSWRWRPFPLRVQEANPTAREVADAIEELRRARAEPGGERLSLELWEGNDPPRSSILALAALEAARLQGPSAFEALASAMQRAALEQGVNVTRPDVAFELASAVGLEMNRFSAAFGSPETRRLILEEHRLASVRGVRNVPTLVLGGRWMVSGLREVGEYRELIRECLQKQELALPRTAERIVH